MNHTTFASQPGAEFEPSRTLNAEAPGETTRATWPAGIDAGSDDANTDDDGEEEVGTGSGLGSRGASNALLRRTVGRRFAEARALNGLDQGEAARLLGWGNSTQLSLIEQGKRMPPHSALLRASEVYGTSVDYLMGASAEPERDAKTAEKMAFVRRVERLLQHNAEAVTEALMASTRETTVDAMRAAKFVERATELVDAALAIERLNPGQFDDARGGARLVRVAGEMEAAIAHINRFVDRADRLHKGALDRARQRTFASLKHHVESQLSGTPAQPEEFHG